METSPVEAWVNAEDRGGGQNVRPQKQGGRVEKRKVKPQAYVAACGSECTRTVLSLATARGLASLQSKQKCFAGQQELLVHKARVSPGRKQAAGRKCLLLSA